MHAAHDVEAGLERSLEITHPMLCEQPSHRRDADDERACAARGGLSRG